MDVEIIKSPVYAWSLALLIAILLSVAAFIALGVLERFKKKQPILEIFSKTHVLFVVIISLYFATLVLDLPDQAFACAEL